MQGDSSVRIGPFIVLALLIHLSVPKHLTTSRREHSIGVGVEVVNPATQDVRGGTSPGNGGVECQLRKSRGFTQRLPARYCLPFTTSLMRGYMLRRIPIFLPLG